MFEIAALEEKFGYPLIVRTTFNNLGVGMVQVRNRAELSEELKARSGQQIYVHEFIDNRTGEGYFRKFRASFIGETIIPTRVDYSIDWKVRGRRIPERQLFYRQRRHLLEEEKKILRVPSEVLSREIMNTPARHARQDSFGHIRYGFRHSAEWQNPVFEANASMNLLGLPILDEEDIRNPAGPENLLKETLAGYLRQRIAEGKTATIH